MKMLITEPSGGGRAPPIVTAAREVRRVSAVGHWQAGAMRRTSQNREGSLGVARLDRPMVAMMT
jgi:hypothetical protein